MTSKEINNRWLYLPILILGINFIIRIINQSKIIKIFPLDRTNDISAYMSHLFFLKTCGFLEYCPYWYNGFTTFTTIPPGWFFFTLPIYNILKNILISTFVSYIIIYIIAFLIIYFLCKLHKISIIKRIAFFLFFYGNAIAIGNFIRLMRIHELFALVFSSAMILIILYYKDHKLNKYSLSLILLYSIVILSHPTIAIMASVMILSLFIIKNNKEKIQLALITIISILITSFWWIPYLKNFKETIGTEIILTKSLLIFNKTYLPQNIASFIVPIGFLIIFYIYYKQQKKSKKELLFYSPIIIISILMITRLTSFIPILKYVYPDSQMHFMLFLLIFMFLKIKKETYKKFIKLIPIALIIISVISVGVNELYTPKFKTYTQFEEDTLELFPFIEGKYIIIGKMPKTSYSKAYFSYGPIFYNLTTSEGWSLPNKNYNKLLKDLYLNFENKNCMGLKQDLIILNTSYVITQNENCNFINSCNLKEIKTKNKSCLYKNEM